MHLLRRVEGYLRRSGVSATRLGREAVNDPRFVLDLRNGREPGARITRRVADYLQAREQEIGR